MKTFVFPCTMNVLPCFGLTVKADALLAAWQSLFFIAVNSCFMLKLYCVLYFNICIMKRNSSVYKVKRLGGKGGTDKTPHLQWMYVFKCFG